MLWLIAAFAFAAEPAPPAAAAPPAPAPPPAPQAEPPQSGPPLAIPGPGAPPPRPPDGRRGGSKEHANALRTYQREALTVRTLSEFYVQPGITTWWGPRWGGFATSTPSTVYRVDDWAVFEGDSRVDVPTYLGRIGNDTAKLDLERRVRTNHTVGVALTTVGVVGLVGSVVGFLGAENSATNADYTTWSTAALGSGAVGLTGLITGSFPLSKAHRLATLPGTTLDRRQVEEDVAAYDERLADQLGLDPEEAFRLEQRARQSGPQ